MRANATTTRTHHNGSLAAVRRAVLRSDGNVLCVNQDYDSAKKVFYTREIGPGQIVNGSPSGKLVETWSELKQDVTLGDFQRRDINGITVAKQSLDTASGTTTILDARGLSTAVSKDPWRNITRIVYPDGNAVSTQYDPTYSNVTQHTDENGVITQNSYDAPACTGCKGGNLLKTVEAFGLPEQRTTDYIVDASGQRTSMTRRGDATTPDAVTQYAYDNNGNVITVTDAEGGITRYTYDAMGNVLSKLDARGKLWQRTYDNQGHLLSVTDPLNRTTRIAYDKTGLPISLTDAANNISTLGYDAAGKLLTVTDPYGAKTSYTYDTAGNITQITDSENHTRNNEYDLDDRLVKQIDGNNNATQYQYGNAASAFNRLLVQIIYPTLSQTLQYDNRDRITQTVDSATGSALALDGSTTQTTKQSYDAASNLIAVTDPANRTTGTTYNAYGQVTQTTDPAGGITHYGYDARGNLSTVTDAKGNTHQYQYDRLDRLLKEIRPLGQTISYTYDAVGNLTQVTDPKGQVKKYTYDDANRRTQENHYLSATALTALNAVKSVNYSYNTVDRLTGYSSTGSLQADNSVATYSYDTRQLRKTGESVNFGSFSLAVGVTYNSLGQKTGTTYPDGATYSYTFDANNQLSTVNLPTGYGSITWNSYTWTAPSQITLPGGTVRKQSYDGLLRLKDLNVTDPGQSQVMSYQYNYDLTNNLVAKATEAGATSYSYDRLDRLTGAAYTGTTQTSEAYTYDAVANRLTDTKITGALSYNANNQLTSAGTVSYTYDENGNTVSSTDTANAAATRNYVYDTSDRLIQVRDANNTLIAVYSYDPFGRRLSKDTGTQKTFYLYNEEGLIAEADATGQVTKSYGYAPNSTYMTNPLFMKTGANYYYYQNDHLGTPQKLVTQSGQVVWSATYDAFGSATVGAGYTLTNNLRLPGQYYDAETGMHYNWMRYYDPKTGRYVTSDPIGLAGGVNLYTYVKGNSIRWIDPWGLWATDAHNAIIDAYGKAHNLPKELIVAMKAGSREADNTEYQDDEHSYMHAMSSSKLTKAQACKKMNEFVTKSITTVFLIQNMYGDKVAEYRELGFGLHAIMDSTSPSHANFKEWHLHNFYEHGDFPFTSEENLDVLNNRKDLLDLSIKRMNAASKGEQFDCPPCQKK
jgi:RHS repeat-associated protein